MFWEIKLADIQNNCIKEVLIGSLRGTFQRQNTKKMENERETLEKLKNRSRTPILEKQEGLKKRTENILGEWKEGRK